jgi:hypothetical protein
MIIPGLALLPSLWLASHASLKSWLVTAAFMLAGTVLYSVTRRKASIAL